MSVYNNIFIGFSWAQEFLIDDAALPDDETLRVSFRRNTQTPLLVDLTDGAGVERTSTGFILRMTEEQTATLVPGHVIGDVATVKEGVDRHLGVRITVPVVRSTTVAIEE
jgi:hypothetical protein